MCSCFRSKLVLQTSNESKSNKRQGRRWGQENNSSSFSVSAQIRDVSVRVVHAGGRIEMYQGAVPVSTVVHKYPGMCIARPTVFKRPHDSLLSDDDILMPGNKYLVIRSTTVEKLKRRHRRAMKDGLNANRGPTKKDEEAVVYSESGEESICASRDFHVPKERWSILSKQQAKKKKKKQFVPPIQRPGQRRETEWEPSLTSIQEVSP